MYELIVQTRFELIVHQVLNYHSLLVEMQSGTVILADYLAVSYKTKHSLTIQSNNRFS